MWELLGLADDDEPVYQYELRHPGYTTAEVAASLGLKPDAVLASRERLLACGLLLRDRHETVRPDPAGPAMVADRIRAELEAEYARRRRQVSLFQAEMTRRLHNQILTAPADQPQIER